MGVEGEQTQKYLRPLMVVFGQAMVALARVEIIDKLSIFSDQNRMIVPKAHVQTATRGLRSDGDDLRMNQLVNHGRTRALDRDIEQVSPQTFTTPSLLWYTNSHESRKYPSLIMISKSFAASPHLSLPEMQRRAKIFA
jgi:hypothetical protein